jgi:hypothetical protein
MIAHMLAEDPMYPTLVIKDNQRFRKRILTVDDDADVTITFKAGIEHSNNNNYANKRIEVYKFTSYKSILRDEKHHSKSIFPYICISNQIAHKLHSSYELHNHYCKYNYFRKVFATGAIPAVHTLNLTSQEEKLTKYEI